MNDDGPWWFSDPLPPGGAEQTRARSAKDGFSLTTWASGAQQIVELAKQAILVPHAGHDDPREHGACIICRGLLVMGDVRRESGDTAAAGQGPVQSATTVRWIDLDPARPDAIGSDADHRLWP